MGLEMMGESMTAEMNMTMQGYVDNQNERMYIDMVTSAANPEGDVQELNVKTAIIGDYAYAITEQGSFKTKLDYSWNQQTQVPS